MTSSTPAGMPMSARSMRPHRAGPGRRRCPGLSRKKVTVTSASIAAPRGWPVSPSSPEGTSTATTRPPRRGAPGVDAFDQLARRAVEIAVEPGAEQGVDHDGYAFEARARRRRHGTRPAACGERGVALQFRPVAQKREATSLPCSCRSRAAMKPSPPLLPGPHRTRMRPPPAPCSRRAASATARPAASMRSAPGVPAAIVRRSASPIWATVNTSKGLGDRVRAHCVIVCERAPIRKRAGTRTGAAGLCPTKPRWAHSGALADIEWS